MGSQAQLIDSPVMPPAGSADPLPALLPATDTTCVAATQVSFRTMTCAQLFEFVKYRAIRVNAHVEGLRRRASELYPALLEVEARYNKQQGARADLHDLKAQGFHEFLYSVGVPPGTFRSWKSRVNTAIKQLGYVVDTDGSAESDGKGRSSGGGISHKKVSPIVERAAENLADAKAQLDRAAEGGNEHAKTIIQQCEQDYADALAKAEADSKGDVTKKSLAETKINKRLAAIVEVGEKYIRVMERVVYSDAVILTDRQRHDLKKASEPWRKMLREARELSWAVKILEGAA
jgi:hypothetical protein